MAITQIPSTPTIGAAADHVLLIDVTADQHHAQTHTHASHTGVGANDHHAQSHTMSQHTDGPYGGGAASTARAFFLS